MTAAALNANQHCPATGGTLGDAKGLDLWTYFPSQQTATWLDVLPVPAVAGGGRRRRHDAGRHAAGGARRTGS